MEGDPSLGEEPQKPDPGVLVGDKILQINKFFISVLIFKKLL